MRTCKYLPLMLLILTCTQIHAQYFNGGLLVGFTASQMDGDMLGGYHKPGLTAGIWVGRSLNAQWNYRAELKYTMKGAASNKPTDLYNTYRKTLHYIELPFVINYQFANNLSAGVGLSAAYLAHATLNTGSGTIDATEPMKRSEINSLMELNYLLNKNFTLNFRFSYSIFPVSHLPGNLTIWNTYAQYNNVLSFAVIYKIK